MKHLLAYLFIVFGFGFVFSANAYSKIYCVDEKIGERIESFRKDYLKRENEFFYTSKTKGTSCMTSYKEVNKKQYNILKNHFKKAKLKLEPKQNNINDAPLKSGIKINKKDKIFYTDFSSDWAFAYFYPFRINDLRGDGVVYYKFIHDTGPNGKYYRLNKNFNIVSEGNFKYNKETKVFLLTEGKNKYFWKIAPTSEIIDIKSKYYDYKGYRRYDIKEARIEDQEQLKSSINNYEEKKYVKVETKQNDINDISLKSALDIDKKRKVKYITHIYDQINFLGYTFLIDDLRENGPVYYQFQIDEYHRLDKDFNVISKGTYEFTGKDPNVVIKLKEGDLKFQWKISVASQVVDIKSKFYKYKGFKRFQIKESKKKQQKKALLAVKNFTKNIYSRVGQYKESDDILNRLYKIILRDKNIKTKYLKYSKKNAVFNGEKIKTLGLAVFIDYKKELSKLTNDKNLKKISPFAWGWGYSSEDTTTATELKAVKKCYLDARKKKFSLRDGECVIVDLREITGDSQNPIIAENYFIKERETKKFLAQNTEKSDQEIANEKKEEEERKKELLIAQKKAEEETKKQEKIFAKRKKEEEKRKKELLIAQKKAEEETKKQEKILLAKKKKVEEKKKALILAKIAATEKKVLKDEARYLGKLMTSAFLDTNEIILDDLRGDGKVYYQFEKDKYFRIQRDGEFISEGKFKISKSGRIILNEKKDKFYWKLSVTDGVIDIKSKFYPYEGYKRFALDFIYKQIAKDQRKDSKKLAKIEKEEKELQKKEIQSKEGKKVKELLLAQKKAEEETKKQELLLAQKKAEEERKKQELLLAEEKAKEEKKKQELLLAQKKAEEEKKNQELLLAQKKADEEKKKQELIAQLKKQEQKKLSELELAKKEAEKEFEKKKKKLGVDKDSPEIIVAETITVSSQAYKLKGKVKDKSDFFLEVDGQSIEVNKEGEFVFEGFIINTNEAEVLTIVAVDRWNNASEKNVKINVKLKEMKVAKGYEKLLPNKINVKKDKNKIAIIIGVEKYENLTNLDAAFANRDANAFREYAVRALGVDPSNINLLVDEGASRPKILKALKLWLPKIGGENRDIFLFFAGHGLASDDGKNLYILPQNSDASLLEDTAITRNEIIKILQKTNPKSVTMFFDTCYSGQTRNEETLVASLRPVRIVADDQAIPDNFTIFTASANDQTSGSIEEAKHGMFSYYLMKGMEGAADENEDKKISNGELIAYIQNNVSKVAFSQNREQDPMLAGDPDKVLMSYR